MPHRSKCIFFCLLRENGPGPVWQLAARLALSVGCAGELPQEGRGLLLDWAPSAEPSSQQPGGQKLRPTLLGAPSWSRASGKPLSTDSSPRAQRMDPVPLHRLHTAACLVSLGATAAPSAGRSLPQPWQEPLRLLPGTPGYSSLLVDLTLSIRPSLFDVPSYFRLLVGPRPSTYVSVD